MKKWWAVGSSRFWNFGQLFEILRLFSCTFFFSKSGKPASIDKSTCQSRNDDSMISFLTPVRYMQKQDRELGKLYWFSLKGTVLKDVGLDKENLSAFV